MNAEAIVELRRILVGHDSQSTTASRPSRNSAQHWRSLAIHRKEPVRLRVPLIAVAAALLLAAPAQATRPNTNTPIKADHCFGQPITVKDFAVFSDQVWRLPRWERKEPKAKTIAAAHRKFLCSRGSGIRGLLRKHWAESKAAFYEHRRRQLWRVRVTPFSGGGHWWALPYGIVVCESGGNYGFTYGAYSILDPAWREWGGQTAHAGEASKREQDRVAAVGWDLYGEGAWECKSDGSTSWP